MLRLIRDFPVPGLLAGNAGALGFAGKNRHRSIFNGGQDGAIRKRVSTMI
jgi:hypothetical protein